MNFKINMWTLLFLIAAVALYYVYSMKKEPYIVPYPGKTGKAKTDTIYPDEIPRMDAHSYMIQYQLRVRPAQEDSAYNTKARVENPYVFYFDLEEDELSQMLHYNEGKNVFAFPVIKDDTIDLIFSIAHPDSINTWSQDTKFFDFSRPCPPTCDKDTSKHIQSRLTY